jgi:hypothetical protein
MIKEMTHDTLKLSVTEKKQMGNLPLGVEKRDFDLESVVISHRQKI